jgi:hypothetical protein
VQRLASPPQAAIGSGKEQIAGGQHVEQHPDIVHTAFEVVQDDENLD